MTAIALHILALAPGVALALVFALPALESSAFVGFVFPGEIALVVGGVLAYRGTVPLGAVLAAGVAGAAVGDSVGYAVGRRYGRRILEGALGRFVPGRHFDRAEDYLNARGARAVFFGRFTAALRVMIPGLAGMAGMRYRTFVTYNVASAVGWGTLSVLLGYLSGSSWQHAAHTASRIGLAVLAAVVAAVLGGHLLRRAGPALTQTLLTREVATFLAVGGAGYVVDVGAFNLLRSVQPFAAVDPSAARTVAVAVAMCVTYLGNRTLTWRDRSSSDRRREVGLFLLFNVIGFGFSLVSLVLSHDVLRLTSRLADNVSANVVGLALGTIFRFLTYRRFVFAPGASTPARHEPTARSAWERPHGSDEPETRADRVA